MDSRLHRALTVLLVFHYSLFISAAQSQPDWRDSLTVLNQLIAKQPSSTDLRLRKAAVNIELNQWDYAIDEYSRVLEMEPANLSALYFRAYANNHERRYDLARRDYEAFLAIMPKHFEAQMGLAMVKRKLNRPQEAIDDLNTLVQLFPDSALAYAARAAYESERQQYDLALFDWDEALRLQPSNTDFLVSKVEVLLAMKRKREARRLLHQAIDAGTPAAALSEWLQRCR